MDLLANLVVVVHIAYFVFVVGGFAATVAGVAGRKPWVRNPWFRIGHLLAVLIVLVEDRLSVDCPLNVLETNLRPAETAANPGAVGGVLDYVLHQTLSERTLDAIYWTIGVSLLILMVVSRPAWASLRPQKRS